MTKQEMREQEEIQKCLNCQYPECVNCLSPDGRYGKIAKKHSKWKDAIQSGVDKGLNDRQIGELLGIDRKTVGNLRRSLGIPSLVGRGRPRGNP